VIQIGFLGSLLECFNSVAISTRFSARYRSAWNLSKLFLGIGNLPMCLGHGGSDTKGIRG
jgi:hypothetical protein